MKPGPGVTSARIAELAEQLGTPLEPWQRAVADRMFGALDTTQDDYALAPPRRVDGSPAVWPSPGWTGRATR